MNNKTYSQETVKWWLIVVYLDVIIIFVLAKKIIKFIKIKKDEGL
jgi:hypothetical protein